ncbi:MAG: hypothetical protein JSS20_02630 [Proteobacteria bacterium]|nr:hypothetical protein [Pseudomonadota bacterium]
MHYATSAASRTTSDGKPSVKPFEPIEHLSGLSVAHRGTSDLKVRLARTIGTASRNPLDGAGIATLPSRRQGEKPIGFTFELLGYGLEARSPPKDVRLQVTGLAQKVWGFASEFAYLSRTPPARLMGKGGMAEAEPRHLDDVQLTYRQKPGSLWLVTGEVRRSMRLINPINQAPYYWIDLETDRGSFDIIANPAVIDGDISNGHIAQVVAAMTARIV